MSQKIKKGDIVLVQNGREKGKKGKVLKVFVKEGRVQIEGINVRKKHTKPKRGGQKGQTVEVFAPLFIPSLALLCPKCSKPTRVGFTVAGSRKYRVCKRCKGEI